MSTQRLPLDEDWTVRALGGDSRRPVRLPHDAMISEPRSATADTGNHGGFFPGGAYVYETAWEVPDGLADRLVTLLFEGVYGDVAVRVNGHDAARWNSGYREVAVDITELVLAGEVAMIEVTADNRATPNSRWYTGSGIYRPVWVELAPPVRLTRDGVSLVTRLEDTTAHVTLDVRTDATGTSGHTVRASLSSTHLPDTVAATAQVEDDGATIELRVPHARTWSAEDPFRYDLTVSLERDGVVLDQRTAPVGLRVVEVDAAQGLRINGDEVLLRGACVHHDNGILGAATHAAAEWRRARILKEQGFNAIRSAHNPLSRAFLDACDTLGLYVMDELTDVWFQPKTAHDSSVRFEGDWRADATAMVAKDLLRPSVIMYSIGNEVAETATSRGIDTAAEIAQFITRLDPGRPTTLAMNFMLNLMASYGQSPFMQEHPAPEQGGETEPTSTAVNMVAASLGAMMQRAALQPRADEFTRGALEHVDVAGYNYAFLRYRPDRRQYPQRVIVGSESMPGDLPAIWSRVRSAPGIIGDFMWTGWDYLGEAGIGTWAYGDEFGGINKPFPALTAGAGVIDITGRRGAPMLLARAVWKQSSAPEVAVRPMDRSGSTHHATPWRTSDAIESWSWRGHEGEPAFVEVYSSDPEVELELNGRSLGRRRSGARTGFLSTFEVPYEPGELTAIGYRGGRETRSTTLRTARTARLRLRPELQDPVAACAGLWFVHIELADDSGIVDASASDLVSLQTDAELLGFGSAASATTQSFVDARHATHYGSALAVVRLAPNATSLSLKAISDEHGRAEITLTR